MTDLCAFQDPVSDRPERLPTDDVGHIQRGWCISRGVNVACLPALVATHWVPRHGVRESSVQDVIWAPLEQRLQTVLPPVQSLKQSVETVDTKTLA